MSEKNILKKLQSFRFKKFIFISLIIILLFIIQKCFFIVTNDKVSILDESNFLMIAHRGASLHAPEHTLESYKLACEKEADYIEIDLQLTSDNVLIAMHDESVDRTTDGTGEVRDFTLEEIKQLDAGKWFNESFKRLSVPTLEEILEEFSSDVNYYIETKHPKENLKMEKLLIDILERHKLLDNVSNGNVVIQSYSEASLMAIKELNDDIPLIQLQKYEKEASITDVELDHISQYTVGLGVNYQSLTQDFIEKVTNHGLVIHSYTVNESSEIKELEIMGVNGIFTDNMYLYDD